jgi:hypothetical protein
VLGLLTCQASTGKDAQRILSHRDTSSSSPTSIPASQVDTVAFALTLQSKFLGGMLATAGIFFAFGLLSTMVLLRDLRITTAVGTPSRARRRLLLRRAALAALWLSVAFSLASAISITQTTDTLAFTTQTEASTVKIRGGATLKALQWLVVASSSLFTAGISGIAGQDASSTALAQKPALPGGLPGPMPGPMAGPMPGPMPGPMAGPMPGPMPGPMGPML